MTLAASSILVLEYYIVIYIYEKVRNYYSLLYSDVCQAHIHLLVSVWAVTVELRGEFENMYLICFEELTKEHSVHR